MARANSACGSGCDAVLIYLIASSFFGVPFMMAYDLAAGDVAGAEHDLEVAVVAPLFAAATRPFHAKLMTTSPVRMIRIDSSPLFHQLHVRLDLGELLERAVDAARGGQHLHDVLRLDAVGHQRDFQGLLGAIKQAALAGIFLHVPEVGPALRRILVVGMTAVVGQAAGDEIVRHAALAEAADAREQPWDRDASTSRSARAGLRRSRSPR